MPRELAEERECTEVAALLKACELGVHICCHGASCHLFRKLAAGEVDVRALRHCEMFSHPQKLCKWGSSCRMFGALAGGGAAAKCHCAAFLHMRSGRGGDVLEPRQIAAMVSPPSSDSSDSRLLRSGTGCSGFWRSDDADFGDLEQEIQRNGFVLNPASRRKAADLKRHPRHQKIVQAMAQIKMWLAEPKHTERFLQSAGKGGVGMGLLLEF